MAGGDDGRLTRTRELEIRENLAIPRSRGDVWREAARDLLAEVDALRAERDALRERVGASEKAVETWRSRWVSLWTQVVLAAASRAERAQETADAAAREVSTLADTFGREAGVTDRG